MTPVTVALATTLRTSGLRALGFSRIVSLALLFGWLIPTPVLTSQAPSTKVNVVGSFDNLRSTAEHTYGYALNLWREGNRVLGRLDVADGQPADFPSWAIDNGTINDSTHRLTFVANARTGASFRFVGTLKASSVQGVLTSETGLDGDPRPPQSESIQLRPNAQAREVMHGYATYEAWKADVITKFLRARAPR